MKKYLFALVAFVALFISSCSNEDIVIEITEKKIEKAVSIDISLQRFYQDYIFDDTKHDIDQLKDEYRAFNSEYNKYIQVRTIFYDKTTGNRVSSRIGYYTNANNIVNTTENLLPGSYSAVTTVCFADKNEQKSAYWDTLSISNIRTAQIKPVDLESMWSIASVGVTEFEVKAGQPTVVCKVTPEPIGALCYCYMENFQFANYEAYENNFISDNYIRSIKLYTQNYATSYNLNPNASSKYNFRQDAGLNRWYSIVAASPTDFISEWTHFKSNLYFYTYMLAPQFEVQFGYILDGENSFNGYGTQSCTLQNGKTYLAYWDWLQVGNPYFGIADNNHWHNYNTRSAREVKELPLMLLNKK